MNRARFLRRYPKPVAPEGGMYLMDPETGQEEFVSWDLLQRACSQIMEAPERLTAEELGKMHYRNDPTYNMRKR